MAGEIDSLGNSATNPSTARVGTPASAAHRDPDAHGDGAGGLCLNCGTARVGDYCHHCGQSGHIHRTMGAIGHDLLHGVLHFEGKTWRTLPMLAFKPGHLTRRYIDGERARFVSPMAIFLFSVFLMFAVVAVLPGWSLGEGGLLTDGGAPVQAAIAKEKAVVEARLLDRRQELAQARAAATRDPARAAKLEQRIAALVKERDELVQAERFLPGGPPVPVASHAAQGASGWLEAKLAHAKENPKLLLYKIKTSAYKFSWALIPISLPFIWLMFPFRRDVGFYDHAIFATYSLAFMSLLVIVLAVAVALGVPAWIATTAAVVIPPLHLYNQLKYGYGLGWFGALWRTALMLFFAIFTLTVFGLALLGLGVSG